MKKLGLLILLAVLAAPMIGSAQELKNPKDCGVKEFDEFKNNSFKIYKNSLKFKTMVENEEKFTAEDIKTVDKLQGELRKLQDKSEEMVKNAKNVKPVTKAPKATKNTQEAAKALKLGGENLKYVTENMIKADE